MKPLFTTLLPAMLVMFASFSSAQPSGSTNWAEDRLAIPPSVKPTWEMYDSLGDAYLLNGDSIMAVYCYGKSIEINTANTGNKKSYEKLKRYYRQQESSFYLKED